MLIVMRMKVPGVHNLPVKLFMFFRSTHCCHLTGRPRCVQPAEATSLLILDQPISQTMLSGLTGTATARTTDLKNNTNVSR